MTGGRPIEAHPAGVAAALRGARGDIIADLRSGLLDAIDAYRLE